MVSSHTPLIAPGGEGQSSSPQGIATSRVKNMKKTSTSKSVSFNADRYLQPAHRMARDSGRSRVSKACERCRLKKIKCDGEVPCQKCKNNGHVCTAGVRKRMVHVEYKQVPKSYVEFLETTHLALIGTVHKLYTMIQKHQSWDLGEPELNDLGELVIHDVAEKLGCIGPDGEINLPIQYELPTTSAGMARLAANPKRQQYRDFDDANDGGYNETDAPMEDRTGGNSPSSDPIQTIEDEPDYRREAFASYNNSITHSPQSLYTIDDSEHSHSRSESVNSGVASSPYLSSTAGYSGSSRPQPEATPDELMLFLQKYGQMPNMETFNWELGESVYNTSKSNMSTVSDFGTMMMNMEDQMVLPEYNDHSTWLSQSLSGWREEGQVPM